MTVVFTNARLVDPEGEVSEGALLAAEGEIRAVGAVPASAGAEVVDCGGLCLAPGIVDLGVKVSEPGERHKESFRSAGAGRDGGRGDDDGDPARHAAGDRYARGAGVRDAPGDAGCAGAGSADGRVDAGARGPRDGGDRVHARCRWRWPSPMPTMW